MPCSRPEPYPIRALDLSRIDPDRQRQRVAYNGPFAPGTVVVSIPERRLFLAQAGGSAIRYAVGVGRDKARNFRGSAVIGRKAEWPTLDSNRKLAAEKRIAKQVSESRRRDA